MNEALSTLEKFRASFVDHWQGAVCAIILMVLLQIWLWNESQVQPFLNPNEFKPLKASHGEGGLG